MCLIIYIVTRTLLYMKCVQSTWNNTTGVSVCVQVVQLCRTAPLVTSSLPVLLFSWPLCRTLLCPGWYDLILKSILLFLTFGKALCKLEISPESLLDKDFQMIYWVQSSQIMRYSPCILDRHTAGSVDRAHDGIFFNRSFSSTILRRISPGPPLMRRTRWACSKKVHKVVACLLGYLNSKQ